MDYEATRRVQQLLTSLTDAKSSSLDAEKLSELKGLLKHSEGAQLVEYTTPLLLDRLACESAQASEAHCISFCSLQVSKVPLLEQHSFGACLAPHADRGPAARAHLPCVRAVLAGWHAWCCTGDPLRSMTSHV